MGSIQKKLNKIAKQFNVALIYSFGSRAGEVYSYLNGGEDIDNNSDSDIDIGVLYNEGHKPSIREKVQLSIKLEDLLPAKKIDLINISEADPFLALEIIRGELLYCSDIDFQSEYELYVLRRAGDLAYFERQKRKMVLGENADDLI